MNNTLSTQTYPIQITPHATWDFQDSSKIKVYQKCPRKYFYEYILGLRLGEQHDLAFGHAVHEALEVLYLRYKDTGRYCMNGVNLAYDTFLADYRAKFDELTDMDKFPKNPVAVEEMLKAYIEHYANDNFTIIDTESFFRFKTSETNILVGKLDLAYVNDRDKVEILEHKTTKWNDFRWAEQWANSIQVNNYALAGYVHYENFKGVRINGIKFFKEYKTALQKERRFERVPIIKSVHGIDDALSTANYWMNKILQEFEMLAESTADTNSLGCFCRNGEACMDFGRTCMFKDYCENMTNPLQDIEMLQRNFDVFWWDPLEDVSEEKIKTTEL